MDNLAGDYPFVIRQAADPPFIDHVLGLIAGNLHHFTPNRVHPQRRKFWSIKDDIDPRLSAKKLELIGQFGIKDWAIDPNLHDLIGYITEGGTVHPHTDRNAGDRVHVRINLLVSKPEAGCIPLLGGIPIDVDVGDAWICFASRCRHATTPVQGPTFRSIVSYGLQVERAEAAGLLAKYLAWKNHRQRAAAAAPA
jgi:hypothetical protein